MSCSSQHPGIPCAEHLALLADVIGSVARRHGLRRDDRLDFAQAVQLRFLERNYEVFTRFRGDSSLRSFLIVVVTRLLLDWRTAAYGKWRPSAATKRLGAEAVRLDRLINRDGYAPHEAVEILHRTTGTERARAQSLAGRVPRRSTRREAVERLCRSAETEPFRDPVEAREDRARAHRMRRDLRQACRRLPAEERSLIALRYARMLTVPEISRQLRVDAKALYRRFDRVLSKLRLTLTDQPVGDLDATH